MHAIVQLFEPQSSTYTYVVYDTHSLEAVIIDPVDTLLSRDMQAIASLSLRLKFIV